MRGLLLSLLFALPLSACESSVPDGCDGLVIGDRYLLSRACVQDSCVVNQVPAAEATPLLDYLAHSHEETAETVLAKTMEWADGRLPQREFHEWIDTTAVKIGTPGDDAFVFTLLSRLTVLVEKVRRMPDDANLKREVHLLGEVARAYPWLNEVSGEERARYENTLMNALDAALARGQIVP